MNKRWKLKETEIIKQNLHAMSVEELQILLPNRTIRSIKLKIAEQFGPELMDKNKDQIIEDYETQKIAMAKVCKKYGVTTTVLRHKLIEWGIKPRTNVKKYSEINGKKNHNWQGFGELPGRMYGNIKRGAMEREIPFDTTIEELWNLFLSQDKKCALSGIELKMHSQRKFCTASLDRIDCNKSYTISNLQWVHKHINIIKNRFSIEEFLFWCRKIINYQDQFEPTV